MPSAGPWCPKIHSFKNFTCTIVIKCPLPLATSGRASSLSQEEVAKDGRLVAERTMSMPPRLSRRQCLQP